MKYFVIIIELLLIAATVGISLTDIPAVALVVAICVCAVFGLFSLIFIVINVCKDIKEAKGKKEN